MKKFALIPLLSAFTLLGSCANKVDQSILNSGIDMVDVIFDAKEGIFEDTGLHAKSIRVRKNYTWKIVKKIAPTGADISYGDFTFVEWLNNGVSIDDTFVFTAPTTVFTAQYSGIDKTVLKLDPGTGFWDSSLTDNTPRIIEVPTGSTWGEYYQSYNELYHANVTGVEYIFTGFNDSESQPVGTDYVIENGPLTFTAQYSPVESCASFANDSWTVFNNALNKGFENLSTKTHAEGGYKEEFDVKNTFVGLTRKVHFYNSDYVVRVIGEDVDPLSDGSGNNAVLTFEFVDVVDNGVGWNSDPSIIYNTATIRNYLNDQFINALPSDFREGLVEVYKNTYSGSEIDPQPIRQYKETIFLPSLSELGISQITIDGRDPVTPMAEGLGADHDEAYAYYDNDSIEPSDLKKYYYKNHNLESTRAYSNYWVRSSDFESAGNAWYISSDVTISDGIIHADSSQSVNIGLGISPCFAMGAQV